ncbi:MAG: site-specific DNA-methyltransferase [Candidatus Marinimicrobia bacterium]|nr:site-specific DNA-methyltransferase [Candidatus Neomarinimicrobiota bacterium]
MNKPVKIGDATLYLADCMDVLPTLEGVQCVITDPPYGIGKAEWDNIDFFPFISGLYNTLMSVTKSGAICFVWMPKKRLYELSKLEFKFDIFIETKNFAQSFPHNLMIDCWVPIMMFSNGKRKTISAKNYFMINTANTSFDSPNNPRNIDHPTVKDVSIISYFLLHSSAVAETILDPFMGSGTTGVAALRLGRKFVGVEIDKKYFQIACERIQREYDQMKLF